MSTPEQDRRRIVVCDVETTGFDPEYHVCVEIAWWDLNTGERGTFIPRHNVSKALAGANIKALQINRYVDRIADRYAEQDHDGAQVRRLADALEGNTLAGSNPRFDDGFLRKVFADYERDELACIPDWHHRLWDLSAYAAGALGLDHLPGLFEVCELLDVATPDHSAEADVTATGECFLALFERAGVRLRAKNDGAE